MWYPAEYFGLFGMAALSPRMASISLWCSTLAASMRSLSSPYTDLILRAASRSWVQFNRHLGLRLGFRNKFRSNFSTGELEV